MKDFNIFMYDHSLHRQKKHFRCYCLQVFSTEEILIFSTEEILKRHIKDYFKIHCEQEIIMPKKAEYVKFKSYEIKIKSPFIIYAAFENILVSDDNGKKNPEESYPKKYQKHIAGSYGYKFVCVDDKLSKPFKTYLGKHVVYNVISNMIKGSKYCSDVIKNILRKNLQ